MLLFLLALWASSVWPMLLVVAAFMAIIAWGTRGPVRALASAAAVVLGLGALPGGIGALINDGEQVARALRHTRLQAETVIDGITFPAGTEVTWTNAWHTRLREASMPQPTNVVGVMAWRVSREQDGWLVSVGGGEIDGWPCNGDPVRVDLKGALLSCKLSRQMEWKGWPLPRNTLIRLRVPGHGVELSLPRHAVVFAHEIGRLIPETSVGGHARSVWLNEDGSLDGMALDQDEPFVVRDTPLCGIVRWQYDATTLGEGRARLPVAVDGEANVAPGSGGTGGGFGRVVVQLSGSAVTREHEVTSAPPSPLPAATPGKD